MTGTPALLLSILMLAAVALVLGGIVQIRRKERRGWLMLVAAAVLVGNVLIWAV
ncbi:LPXTG cell wall anchor domain-containing protein [Sphingomonas sp. ID1715]|uniref:LPXTG cell wall anchor domain-containing protein n=1 Tax=Sphingomonas sp. ID1715 TaxID=1656898 RepID=UPI001488A020|nr:LPXTG cell wall anchor domain-containing protein [Sphingomonas sp. ID1715]NNM76250.1 LPXTG cell wall anchor domain-containing protein [Sphingomonas sp. ID1715]